MNEKSTKKPKILCYVQMVTIYIKIHKDFPFLDVNKVHTKQYMPQRLLCVKQLIATSSMPLTEN